MYTSGVAIGIAQVPIALQAKQTHRVRNQVATAFCVVVVGTTMRATVVLRIVSAAFLRTRAPIAVSVLFASLSLRKIAICYGEQVKLKDLRVRQMARKFLLNLCR